MVRPSRIRSFFAFRTLKSCLLDPSGPSSVAPDSKFEFFRFVSPRILSPAWCTQPYAIFFFLKKTLFGSGRRVLSSLVVRISLPVKRVFCRPSLAYFVALARYFVVACRARILPPIVRYFDADCALFCRLSRAYFASDCALFRRLSRAYFVAYRARILSPVARVFCRLSRAYFAADFELFCRLSRAYLVALVAGTSAPFAISHHQADFHLHTVFRPSVDVIYVGKR